MSWRCRFDGEEEAMGRSRSRGVRREEKQWIEILRRFEESGLGTTAFCDREGLALSSFQRWRRRIGSGGGARFMELVPPPPSAPSASWSVELTLPGGLSLRLRG